MGCEGGDPALSRQVVAKDGESFHFFGRGTAAMTTCQLELDRVDLLRVKPTNEWARRTIVGESNQ
jgi:hypothetical protein